MNVMKTINCSRKKMNFKNIEFVRRIAFIFIVYRKLIRIKMAGIKISAIFYIIVNCYADLNLFSVNSARRCLFCSNTSSTI